MLTVLVGATDRIGTQKWYTFIDLKRDSTQTTKDVTDLRESLTTEAASIKVANPAVGRVDPPTEFTLDQALSNLEQHLAEVDVKKKQFPEEKKKLEEGLAKAIKALDANNASQEQFTDLVTEINALLKKAKDESNPYLELLVSEAGVTAAGKLQERLDAFIKVTDPKDLMERVAVNIADRQAKLQRSRESADAWVGTLNPAVATLTAYGEGGIDPKILAELLKTIGIGAIAVGVN